MADTQTTRRSGRTRKRVTTYAEEQTEQQPIVKTMPAKRKKASGDAEGESRPAKKTKRSKAQANDVYDDATAVQEQPPADDEAFAPPKKTKKSTTKRKKAIGKVDARGIMRLDVMAKRPPGERKPPQVWEVPERNNAMKGKSINLAALLAESFEERRERQVSKIPRLKPGETETRLKA